MVRPISIGRFRSHHNSLNTGITSLKKTGAEEKNPRRYKPQIAGSSFTTCLLRLAFVATLPNPRSSLPARWRGLRRHPRRRGSSSSGSARGCARRLAGAASRAPPLWCACTTRRFASSPSTQSPSSPSSPSSRTSTLRSPPGASPKRSALGSPRLFLLCSRCSRADFIFSPIVCRDRD
jgi:hypothetical protein